MSRNFSAQNSSSKLGDSTNLINTSHLNQMMPSALIEIQDKNFKREQQKTKYSDISQEKLSCFKQDVPNISTATNSHNRSISTLLVKNKENSSNLVNLKFSANTRKKESSNLNPYKSITGTPSKYCSTNKKNEKMKLSDLNNFSARNIEDQNKVFNSAKQQQKTSSKKSNDLYSTKKYNNNNSINNSNSNICKTCRNYLPNNFGNSTNSFYKSNSKSKQKIKNAYFSTSGNFKKSKQLYSSRSFSCKNYVNQSNKQYLGIDLNLVSNSSHNNNNNFNSQIQKYIEIYNENELNGDINSNNGEIITGSNMKTNENIFEIEKNDEINENEIENGDSEQTIINRNFLNKNNNNNKNTIEINGDSTIQSKQSISKNNNSKISEMKKNSKINNNSNNSQIIIEHINTSNNNSKNNTINNSSTKSNNKSISKSIIENKPRNKKIKNKENTPLSNNSNAQNSQIDSNSIQPINQSTPMTSFHMYGYEAESSPTNYIKSITYMNTITQNNNSKFVNGKNGLSHIISKSISDGQSLHSINKSRDDEEHYISYINSTKSKNKDKEEEKRIIEKLEKIHIIKNSYVKKQQLKNENIDASQFTIEEKDEESDLDIQKKNYGSEFIIETKKILEKSNINKEICDSERETIENQHRLEKLRMQKMKEEEFERNEMINRIKKEQKEIEEKEKKERLEILKKEQKIKEEQILKEIEKQRDFELEEKKLKMKLEEEKIRKKLEQEKLEKYLKEDEQRQKQKIEIENKKLILQKKNDNKMRQIQEMKEKLEKERQSRINLEKQSKLLEQKFKNEIENNKMIESINKINNINKDIDKSINNNENDIYNDFDKNINDNINNKLDKFSDAPTFNKNISNSNNEKNNENLDYVVSFDNNNSIKYNKKFITAGLSTDHSSLNNNKSNNLDNLNNLNSIKNQDINTINLNLNNNTIKEKGDKIQNINDSCLDKEFFQVSNNQNNSFIEYNNTITQNISNYQSLQNSYKKKKFFREKTTKLKNKKINRANSQTGFQIEIIPKKEKKYNHNKSIRSFSFNINRSLNKKTKGINKEIKEEKIINKKQEDNNSKIDDILAKFKNKSNNIKQNNSTLYQIDDIYNNKNIENKTIAYDNSKIRRSSINNIFRKNKNNKNSLDFNNDNNNNIKNINNNNNNNDNNDNNNNIKNNNIIKSFLNNSNYYKSKFNSIFDYGNPNKKANNNTIFYDIEPEITENNMKKNKAIIMKNKFFSLGLENYSINNNNYKNIENDGFFNLKSKILNDDIIKTNKKTYGKIPHHSNRNENKKDNLNETKNGNLWIKDFSFNNNITLGNTEQSSGYLMNSSSMNTINNNNSRSKIAFKKKNNSSLICPANPFDTVNEAKEYFFFNDK